MGRYVFAFILLIDTQPFAHMHRSHARMHTRNYCNLYIYCSIIVYDHYNFTRVVEDIDTQPHAHKHGTRSHSHASTQLTHAHSCSFFSSYMNLQVCFWISRVYFGILTYKRKRSSKCKHWKSLSSSQSQPLILYQKTIVIMLLLMHKVQVMWSKWCKNSIIYRPVCKQNLILRTGTTKISQVCCSHSGWAFFFFSWCKVFRMICSYM